EGCNVGNLNLKPEPFLGGYHEDFDGVSLREVDDVSLISLALPLNGEAPATAAIESNFGVVIPVDGYSSLSTDGSTRVVRVARDQVFVSFPNGGVNPEAKIANKLDGTAYLTDQSHVWVMLEITGRRSRSVLERICPIDLHAETFAIGQMARTSMEHLGAIVVRTDDDTFLLMSASSSAFSFLHAVETSITNVI
ncbi:MAG: hypothetical protein P8L32_02710, partial [Paracoccaceae bacterium]|nr:hypothetical protein [Paracoccaceae bacterium]